MELEGNRAVTPSSLRSVKELGQHEWPPSALKQSNFLRGLQIPEKSQCRTARPCAVRDKPLWGTRIPAGRCRTRGQGGHGEHQHQPPSLLFSFSFPFPRPQARTAPGPSRTRGPRVTSAALPATAAAATAQARPARLPRRALCACAARCLMGFVVLLHRRPPQPLPLHWSALEGGERGAPALSRALLVFSEGS